MSRIKPSIKETELKSEARSPRLRDFKSPRARALEKVSPAYRERARVATARIEGSFAPNAPTGARLCNACPRVYARSCSPLLHSPHPYGRVVRLGKTVLCIREKGVKNTGRVYVRAHVHAYAKSNFKTGGRRKKRVPAGATGERAVTSSSTGRTGRRRSGGSALDAADVREDVAGLSVTRLLVVARAWSVLPD